MLYSCRLLTLRKQLAVPRSWLWTLCRGGSLKACTRCWLLCSRLQKPHLGQQAGQAQCCEGEGHPAQMPAWSAICWQQHALIGSVQAAVQPFMMWSWAMQSSSGKQLAAVRCLFCLHSILQATTLACGSIPAGLLHLTVLQQCSHCRLPCTHGGNPVHHCLPALLNKAQRGDVVQHILQVAPRARVGMNATDANIALIVPASQTGSLHGHSLPEQACLLHGTLRHKKQSRLSVKGMQACFEQMLVADLVADGS